MAQPSESSGSGWDSGGDGRATDPAAVATQSRPAAAAGATSGPGLRPLDPSDVRLLPSPFQHRWQLSRDYLVELKNEHLVLNHRFEAGVWGASQRLPDIHGGWEFPHAVTRGHFLGHWMSAAARIVKATGDPVLRGKLEWMVTELGRLQEENGGEWVYSIPPRDLDRVIRGRVLTFATSYLIEKTLSGLLEAYRYTGNDHALEILLRAARHLHRWTGSLNEDQLENVTLCFTGNMTELWADVFSITGNTEHLDLMRRYERKALIDGLLAGRDVLTNRHANDTIPFAHGAARAYEVTGDERYRTLVEAYWAQAVTDRGYFCTGGQTHGEVWTPPGQLAARVGARNQELCTVYNMRRLAEYLWRWTSDPTYADYRERNLWNGIMAQQHPITGMPTYFLPLAPGSTKTWGSRTEDFWCCHGTVVQAHAQHGWDVAYEDDDGLVIADFPPCDVTWRREGATVSLRMTDSDPGHPMLYEFMDLSLPVGGRRPEFVYHRLEVESDRPVGFALRLRVPWWAAHAEIRVDGEPLLTAAGPSVQTLTREWTRSIVEVRFWRRVVAEPLLGDPTRFALLDGPVVLAGLCTHEVPISGDPSKADELLTADEERGWHEWSGRFRLSGRNYGLRFMPLHQVTDETYTVHFPIAPDRSS